MAYCWASLMQVFELIDEEHHGVHCYKTLQRHLQEQLGHLIRHHHKNSDNFSVSGEGNIVTGFGLSDLCWYLVTSISFPTSLHLATASLQISRKQEKRSEKTLTSLL